MIHRREDWPERLREYIFAASGRRFSWAGLNCCTFAAGAVKAMTDVDPAAAFKAKPKSKKAAYVAVKKYAGGDVLELARKIAEAYDMAEILPTQAQRGDVVYLESEEGGALGVVDLSGARALFIHPTEGAGAIPLNDCKHAWRVG